MLLLSIVEVPKHKRVRCQAEGCGHPVYKRIHVVDVDGALTVLGSECFKRAYGLHVSQKPAYGSGSGSGEPLSDAEAELLIHNTQEFIDSLKRAHMDAQPPIEDDSGEAQEVTYAHSYEGCLEEIRREFKGRGLNPDIPGWAGLVRFKAKKLFEAREEDLQKEVTAAVTPDSNQ